MPDAPQDPPPRILVVDDEHVIREILADYLSMEGFTVGTATDGAHALGKLADETFDLVLSDLKMPRMGGIELLEILSKRNPSIITVIMTGFGTVETAIDAMKRGAYDYIMKPFKMEEVVHTVRRGLERRKLEAENLRLKETLSLFQVNESIADSLQLEQVIATTLEALIREVRPDAVLVLLREGDGPLSHAHGARGPGMYDEDLGELHLERLAAHAGEGHLLVHGADAHRFFSRLPVQRSVVSLMSAPLRVGGRSMGQLVAISATPGKTFEEGQRKVLTIVSNRTAAALDNAKLYRDLQSSFDETIQGLASFIDTMDRRTAGHSQRVAVHARHTALALTLPAAEVELVRQSALMHDVGKIGCALKLNKSEPLTLDEVTRLRQHPTFGKEILEPISHLKPLVPGVYLHHERWDGSGYPLGLMNDNIPLMARIIAVADAYDAMTSDRSYRAMRTHDDALAELRRCSGSEFDPQIVEAFLGVVDSAFQELHQLANAAAASGSSRVRQSA